MRTTWRRTAEGSGFVFDTETTEYENLLEVPAETSALSGLSGLLLFLRLAPLEAARYAFPELDPNPAGGDPLVMPARLDVHRIAPCARTAFYFFFFPRFLRFFLRRLRRPSLVSEATEAEVEDADTDPSSSSPPPPAPAPALPPPPPPPAMGSK